MDITAACKTIRAWRDLMDPTADARSVPGGLSDALAELKRYLELARGDGKPIAALEVPVDDLITLDAFRGLMPYVTSAESLFASQRRRMKS